MRLAVPCLGLSVVTSAWCGLLPIGAMAQSPPVVSVVAIDSIASEPSSGTTAVGTQVTAPAALLAGAFRVSLSRVMSFPVAVQYTVSGSATAGSDYTALAGQVTIAPGSTSFTITVTPLDDAQPERDEDIRLTIGPGQGYTPASGSAGSAVVTLLDNDQTIQLTATDAQAAEPAGTGSVKVERLGTLRGNLAVRLTWTGTAVNGTDYTLLPDSVVLAAGQPSTTLTITPVADPQAEGTEQVTVRVSGLPFQPTSGVGVSIVDAVVSLSAASTTVTEGSSTTLTLTRTGDLGAALALTLTASGAGTTPAQSADFQPIPSPVTIPASQASITIPFVVNADAQAEGPETIFVAIGPNTQIARVPASVTITIPSNGSAASAITLGSSVAGGGALTGTVTLVSAAPAGGAVVQLNTATPAGLTFSAPGASSSALPFNLPVGGGQTTATFTVQTSPVGSDDSRTITATPGGVSTAFTIRTPRVAALGFPAGSGTQLVDSVALAGGAATTLRVRLDTAGSLISVQLTASDAVLKIPGNVSVQSGQNEASVVISAGPVTTNRTVIIVASRAGSADTARVVVLAPVTIASLAVSPSVIASASTGTGTVTLSAQAPAGGTVVSLTSNSVNATVPPSATVAAGQTSATFPITVPPFGASANQVVQIATSVGTSSATQSVTLEPFAVALSFQAMVGGKPSTVQVQLNKPAPSQGITVSLSSSNAAIVLPPTVVLGPGIQTFFLSITPLSLASPTFGALTATFGGSSNTQQVSVQPALVNAVTLNPTSIFTPGGSSQATIALEGTAPAGGLSVAISTGSSQLVTAPATIVVPEGAGSQTFTVATTGVAGFNTVSIQATAATGPMRFGNLQVTPIGMAAFTMSPDTVAAGASATATITLNSPAPSGGLSASIVASFGGGDATFPSAVSIPQGQATASFSVTAGAGSAGRVVFLQVTVLSSSRTASLAIR